MSIGLPKGKPKNLRLAACSKCGNIWSIAITQDTKKGYYCPECSKGRGAKYENRANQRSSAKETIHREEN